MAILFRLPHLMLLALCTLATTAFSQDSKDAPVTALEQTLKVLPREVLGGLRTSKRDAAALEGTGLLQEKVQGRTATLKLKMERVEKDPSRDDKLDRFRIKAEDTRANEGGVPFVIHLWVHCAATESEKIKALRKGQTVTVTGKITLASITVHNPNKIQIDLSEATLE